MNTNNKLGLGGATFGGSKNNNKIISSKIFGNVSIDKSTELIEYAFRKSLAYILTDGMNDFNNMIKEVNEN